MKTSAIFSICALASLFAACSDSAKPQPPVSGSVEAGVTPSAIVHRSDIQPVTRVEDAKPGVFIPPFVDCRAPLDGEKTTDPSGKVCTNVAISGATEAGKSFAKYASCGVVLTQRPYYPAKPAKVPAADDPRVNDRAFMDELAWAKSQIASSGCVCCHDATVTPRGPSQWDINASPIWLDTLSDPGLSLFAGLADSSVLGAYPADQNHDFDRTATGIPTTDTARMKRFVTAEIARRGISDAQAKAVPPFGGPIYTNSIRPPAACGAGEGVQPDGKIVFKGVNSARYVYILEAGSKNPGVPPNLDRPVGTRWRLDVLPSAEALPSGIPFGTTPTGSYQDTPATGEAMPLEKGKTYHLSVLKDVGVPLANCLFVYGDAVPPVQDAGTPVVVDGGTPVDGGTGFGATCTDSPMCAAPTTYCAKMLGATSGYCTVTGCKENATVCPAGWGCLDLSMFQPGAPSICTKP
jgi:hypothetical protein